MPGKLTDDDLRAITADLVQEGCPTVARLRNEGQYSDAHDQLLVVILKLHQRRAKLAMYLAMIGPNDTG